MINKKKGFKIRNAEINLKAKLSFILLKLAPHLKARSCGIVHNNLLNLIVMKKNETGHYKNVVNLNALKVFAEGLGTQYNPQKDSLKLPNLILLTDNANALHNAVRDQINTLSLSVDQRQLIFKDIRLLATRVLNTAVSTNVDPKTIEDAKFYNAKIQGIRIKKKAAVKDGEEQEPANSVSRQSFDSLYENFRSLNDLLIQDGNYKPLETDITNTALTARQNEMLAANQEIGIQLNDLAAKRILRNNMFYLADNSLMEVAKGIKKYIQGKYGFQSAEYNQVKSLSFRDLKMK